MRPSRRVAPPAVAVLLVAAVTACTASISGGGSPAADPAPAGRASTPGPTATAVGNGVAALPADDVLIRARAALAEARSVRVSGVRQLPAGTLRLDIRYRGADSVGSWSTAGETFDLRKIGRTLYFRGNERYWRKASGAYAAQLLTGSWVRAAATDPRFADVRKFADLAGVTADLFPPPGVLTRSGLATVDGVDAVTLEDGSLTPTWVTLSVAAAGRPYPLRAVGPGAAATRVTFSEYDRPVRVRPPPAGETVDFAVVAGAPPR